MALTQIWPLSIAGNAKGPPEMGFPLSLLAYCKSRIFRTHSIFVSWALQPFVRIKFPYSRWPLPILWLALCLSHAFYFRTEAMARLKYTKITGIQNILDLQYFLKVNDLERHFNSGILRKRHSNLCFYHSRRPFFANQQKFKEEEVLRSEMSSSVSRPTAKR